MKSFRSLAQISIAASFLWTNVFAAEDITPAAPALAPDDIFSFVTAVSKRQQTQAEAPGIVTVMTAEEMEELGVRTIEEALRLIPGFEVSFGARRSTVYTRGLVESALVLLDGTSIVSPLDGEVFMDEGISLDIVDRIEVIRGPGGVLWGPTAFVGVINIITKSHLAQNDSVKARVSYGSYDTKKLGASFYKANDSMSLFANYSDLRTDDYELSSPELRSPITGYWGDGYKNKDRKEDFFKEFFLKYSLGDLTLTTRLADEMDYYQIDDRRTVAKGFDLQEKDPIKTFLTLEYKKKMDMLGVRSKAWTVDRESKLTGTYTMDDHPSGNIQWIYDTWQVRQTGAEAEFTLDNWAPGNTVLMGASYIKQKGSDIMTWDYVSDWSGGSAGDVVDPNEFYIVNDFGFIISPEVGVNSASVEYIKSYYGTVSQSLLDVLTLSGGYRFDDNSDYDSVQHYSGSAVWQMVPNHYLKYMYSEGFRPPDWEQKNSVTRGGGDDLRPEKSASHDVQYNAQIGGVSYFTNFARTVVDDLVTFDDLGLRYRNSGRKVVHSTEFGARWQMPRKQGYIFGNYNHKKVDEADSGDVTYIANGIANAGVYKTLPGPFATSFTFHYEGPKSQDMFPAGTRTNVESDPKVMRQIPAFNVVNWGTHYKKGGLKLSLFVYNLFNNNYHSAAFPGVSRVPIPNPRRNLMANLSYEF